MAKKDKGHYSTKHPGVVSRKKLRSVEEEESRRGDDLPPGVPGSRRTQYAVAQIGKAMDILEIPISKCQLGLFGYSPVSRIIQPAESVPEDLEAAIRKAMIDGRLPCAAAFHLAADFKLAKIRVSSACEKLKIRVSACQLGAF